MGALCRFTQARLSGGGRKAQEANDLKLACAPTMAVRAPPNRTRFQPSEAGFGLRPGRGRAILEESLQQPKETTRHADIESDRKRRGRPPGRAAAPDRL